LPIPGINTSAPDIGADVLFPPILLALEKEKPFQKFATLCLLVKTSPIHFAGMGGNENKEFYMEQHVHIANNSQSPLPG
jgi:hypothetical protein